MQMDIVQVDESTFWMSTIDGEPQVMCPLKMFEIIISYENHSRPI